MGPFIFSGLALGPFFALGRSLVLPLKSAVAKNVNVLASNPHSYHQTATLLSLMLGTYLYQ
jgi:hypothetical protein